MEATEQTSQLARSTRPIVCHASTAENAQRLAQIMRAIGLSVRTVGEYIELDDIRQRRTFYDVARDRRKIS